MSNSNDNVPIVKAKRGRKPKPKPPLDAIDNNQNTIISTDASILHDNTENGTNDVVGDIDKPLPKKRGRKPKGGKIIQPVVLNTENKEEEKISVILHLKCSLKDLDIHQDNDLAPYNFSSDIAFEPIITNNTNNFIDNTYIENTNNSDDATSVENTSNIPETKEIWKKLKQLEQNLYMNDITDKKSACFWCTYEFDNPPIYIPKFFLKESYHVYGCFCSPECSTAYLMEESIDSSTKFERYHLLNHIYAKIYNYTKNIKPAPNPYYMLDKYYGNLSIQEYRALLSNERLFLIVDKPLTRVMPELHQDNEDHIINNKIIPSHIQGIKKRIQRKTTTKNNIINENFGLLGDS